MTKFIFEDNESTPSSRLLSNSHNGSNMIFTGGCGRVFRELILLTRLSDIRCCIVFYDVSPNNRNTVRHYQRLVDDIHSSSEIYFKVLVVPIICIEYIILRMLNRHEYLPKDVYLQKYIDSLVTDFNWGDVSGILSSQDFGCSLEKTYKYMLNNQALRCLRNTVRKENDIFGRFYLQKCDCERKFCSTSVTDDLIIKAERLYCELPVFDVVSSEHELFLYSSEITARTLSLKDKEQRFYNDICIKMGVPTFDILGLS